MNMKTKIKIEKVSTQSVGKVMFTVFFVVLAWMAGKFLWHVYTQEPWTRDGRVKANIYQIAPDVSGLVSDVFVKDNQQVKQGDILLQIDKQRFALAVEFAEANLKQAIAAKELAQHEYQRNQTAGNAVSTEALERAKVTLAQSEANVLQMQSNLDKAKLDLERSVIRAPENGIITNFDLKQGNYLTAGRAVLALIDDHSFYVEGYFEETKLQYINIGDPVTVVLMGSSVKLTGKVESFAAGIAEQERTTSANLLPSITPNFNWVRLAQRVPVRIKLDNVPEDLRLFSGQTVTIKIEDRR